MKLLIMQISTSSCHFYPLSSKYPSLNLFFGTPSVRFMSRFSGLWPWRWRQRRPLKLWYLTIKLHVVRNQKTEDGGSMDLWNVGILSQHYTASQPWKDSNLHSRENLKSRLSQNK